MLRRAVLVFAGLALGVALAEVALRTVHERLPSLAPAKAADFDTEPFETLEGHISPFHGDKRCHRVRTPGPSPSETTTHHGTGGPPLALWFTGDSVTRGMGVDLDDAFPVLVAEDVAAALGREVVLTNLAYSGAGFCGVLNAVHQQLSVATPDLVVVVLFSDDLEDRAMMRMGGEVVGFPSTVGHPLGRRLVRGSYLANLAWFVWLQRDTDPPRRFVGHGGQHAFAKAQQKLDDEVASAGGAVLRVLLPAPGVPFCAAATDDADRCAWLVSDLDLMASLLEDAGTRSLDLREVWASFSRAPGIPEEVDFDAEGNVPIHPDPTGHRTIADALAPPVAAEVAR